MLEMILVTILIVIVGTGVANLAEVLQERKVLSINGPEQIGFGPRAELKPPAAYSLALESSEAVRIGRAELALPESELWDRMFHRLLELTGHTYTVAEAYEEIEERSWNGKAVVVYSAAPRWIEDCVCGACRRQEKEALRW
jgi:hypothetical protein